MLLLGKNQGRVLALLLGCLMMLAPVAGLIGLSFSPESEGITNAIPEREMPTLALDDPPLRMTASLAYDSESDRIIFFGGTVQNLDVGLTDTWSYDYGTNTWTNMSPASNPPACEFYSIAYHSGEDKVVLFGGHVSGTSGNWLNHNETWVYDYNTNTWTDMDPVLAPPAMSGGAMDYDSESDLIVLHGGWPDGGVTEVLSETWTYDLTTNTWTNVTTSNEPSPRTWGAMAYDSGSDLMVFFGGFQYQPEWLTLDDTWTFDTDTNTWTEIDTVGPEIVGELVYHTASDKIIFYGGAADVSELIEDLRSETWVYDTDTEAWEKMTLDVAPPVRARGELAYDIESNRVILFSGVWDGGWETEVVLGDCWSYDLGNNLWNNVDWDWQEVTPAESPGLRCGSPLVYDIESDRMVIFSGWPNLHADGARYNDTWTYDVNTNTWTNMSPEVLPTGRGGHAMAYHEAEDVMVMFGGSIGYQVDDEKYVADTWTYDLNSNTWTNMSPASSPTRRTFTTMAYDNDSEIIVLFGGFMTDHGASHETWEYNLTANIWTNTTTSTHPDKRFFGSLFYDYTDNRMLLAGGVSWEGMLYDIWEYDVTTHTWSEIVPANDPPTFAFVATYDLESELVIAYGGPTNMEEDIFVEETWSFNFTSNTWNNTFSPNSPSGRSRHFLAYDIESDLTVLYGGALPDGSEGEALGDTRIYDYRVNEVVLKPPPPEGLAVTQGTNSLALSWTPPSGAEGFEITGYRIYRGDEVGEYEVIAEVGSVTTYTDLTTGFDITYYYVVTTLASTGESEFSDPDEGSLSFSLYDDGIYTFIAYGDTRASDETAVAAIHDDLVSRYIQLSDPEMVIHSGDMVLAGGEEYQWTLFDASIQALWDWDPDLEFFGAAGNHELYTDVYGVNDEDLSTYQNFFDFSSVVDEPGETELYYSFDRHGVHFIILNTVMDWDDDAYTCPTAQMEWLEADLAKGSEVIVVVTHYPPFSVLENRPDRLDQAESIRDTFHDLFVEHGVDLVFTGHNHYYYHTSLDGIQYVTSAGGGAPLYSIQKSGTDWKAGDVGFSEYHYCECKINPAIGRLTINVVLMNGSIAESFYLTIPSAGFPIGLTLVVVGGAVAAVLVVMVVYKRRR